MRSALGAQSGIGRRDDRAAIDDLVAFGSAVRDRTSQLPICPPRPYELHLGALTYTQRLVERDPELPDGGQAA